MMKKRYSVLIRTAGGITSSKELGLGHIFRCINLAKKLKRHKIHFLVEDYGSVKEILNKNGFSNVSIFLSFNLNCICLFSSGNDAICFVRWDRVDLHFSETAVQHLILEQHAHHQTHRCEAFCLRGYWRESARILFLMVRSFRCAGL